MLINKIGKSEKINGRNSHIKITTNETNIFFGIFFALVSGRKWKVKLN